MLQQSRWAVMRCWESFTAQASAQPEGAGMGRGGRSALSCWSWRYASTRKWPHCHLAAAESLHEFRKTVVPHLPARPGITTTSAPHLPPRLVDLGVSRGVSHQQPTCPQAATRDRFCSYWQRETEARARAYQKPARSRAETTPATLEFSRSKRSIHTDAGAGTKSGIARCCYGRMTATSIPSSSSFSCEPE